MEYLDLNGKNISRLVYGTGNQSIVNGTQEEASRVLDHAWEAGFRIFDTAYSYGKAEEQFGTWMEERGVRDQLVIIDKGCNPGQSSSLRIRARLFHRSA